MDPLILSSEPGAPAAAPAGLIKDGTTDSFMADVIDASQEVPVIVDFWATWCGPCKQLGPALEKAVKDARGAVRLVKIDVDKNQELAAQMRIQSIPAVYAFLHGRPVDGFVGAVPESQIKSFVQRLVQMAGGAVGPSPIEQALEQADAALAEGDSATASAVYAQVLQHEPQNPAALGGQARAHLAAGEREAAIDELLEIVRRNRGWNDEAARKQLVKLFEAMGPTDPLTLSARRRLSSILFS